METPLTYEGLLEIFRLSDERLNQKLAQERAERLAREAERDAREAQERAERLAREAERDAREAQEREAREAERNAREAKEREAREAERNAREAERDAREAERNAERDAREAKERAERLAANKELDRKIAGITDTLGRFAEGQVRPVAIELFQRLNIPIYEEAFNAKKLSPEKRFLYEVDILLYNTDFVVALEVKNTLRKEDIDEHIARLELMQQYPLKGTRGTKIIGAMAGMNVSNDVVNYTIKNGMYAIVPNGAAVCVANDDAFMPLYWDIKS